MADCFGTKMVTTRKPHVCFGCGRSFPAKAKMQRSAVVDMGIWSCYLCETCVDVCQSLESGDEFGFSDLRDDALALEMKTTQKGAEHEATV